MNIKLDFKFYLVRNKEGKYFRAKGYGGYGDTWVEDPKKARVYQKIGLARSRVTYFATAYPQFGIPNIVEVSATEGVILDESERVEKAKKSIAFKKIRQDKRNAEYWKKRAEESLKLAQEELRRLSG